MKTAEEWNKRWVETVFHPIAEEHWDVEDYEQFYLQHVRAIQLDAMKEGARRATEIRDCVGVSTVSKAILTTAEQWTEKDL